MNDMTKISRRDPIELGEAIKAEFYIGGQDHYLAAKHNVTQAEVYDLHVYGRIRPETWQWAEALRAGA